VVLRHHPAALWDTAAGDLRERIAQIPGQHTPFYAPDRLPSLRRGVEALVGATIATLSTPDGAA
jgi:hippurate hydrolase